MAASPAGAREIQIALGDSVDHRFANTFQSAVELLQAVKFRLIILGYYFDESRPYRFLSHARANGPAAPILLVRAVGLPLEVSGGDIATAYQSLGVEQFFNLPEMAARVGIEEARRLFREAVVRKVPPFPGS